MNEHRTNIDWRPALRFAARHGQQAFLNALQAVVEHERAEFAAAMERQDAAMEQQCAAFRREFEAELKAEHAAWLAKKDAEHAARLAKKDAEHAALMPAAADEVCSKLQAEFAEENRRLVAANRALAEENSKLAEENRKFRALCGAEAV